MPMDVTAELRTLLDNTGTVLDVSTVDVMGETAVEDVVESIVVVVASPDVLTEVTAFAVVTAYAVIVAVEELAADTAEVVVD